MNLHYHCPEDQSAPGELRFPGHQAQCDVKLKSPAFHSEAQDSLKLKAASWMARESPTKIILQCI